MKMLDPYEKAALISLLEKMPTTTPCTACINYACGSCNLWGEPIPADAIKDGCEKWGFCDTNPPL